MKFSIAVVVSIISSFDHTAAVSSKSSKSLPKDPIDKSVLTCSLDSQPTFCSSPDATIGCESLVDRMNQCTALVPANSNQYSVYDPKNCDPAQAPTGWSKTPIVGCNAGGLSNCRYCGFDTYKPCAYGFFEPFYEQGNDQLYPNERNTVQTVNDMLGIPVQIDCDVFYARLQDIVNAGCRLDSVAFQYYADNPTAPPMPNCPPVLQQLFLSNGINRVYQDSMTTNSFGETFPKFGPGPGENPTLLPNTKFQSQCLSLALGQETNMGDAGEISTFELTAITMASRMLRPALFDYSEGIVNCCEIDYADPDAVPDCSRCNDYAANRIDNPRTYINATNQTREYYQYPVPSATRPQESSYIGQRSRRVAKGMHGKGQSCVAAKFSFRPLKLLYNDKNLKSGDPAYIPKRWRVGLLDPALASSDVEIDTLVRLSGNKNITFIKDVHDIRIRGFGIKLLGVGSIFKRLGLPYNRLKLGDIPAYNQPDDAQYTFGHFNFSATQEDENLDLLHVAIGTGTDFDNIPPFDPTTIAGSKNPPANIFVARNVDNYYNGFILGGKPDVNVSELTDVYQNPLSYIYGSSSALRAGPGGAFKLHWAVCPGEQHKIQNVYSTFSEAFKDPNFFATNLKETLQKLDEIGEIELRFCGYIQLQQNPCTEPIESPTTRWLTESINVFELTFPLQTVPDYNTFCDNTVYSPWRTIQENQPEGFINRVRMAVYQYANNFRLILNNGVQDTPHGATIGQNACPLGYKAIPKGKRPPYQGQPVITASQEFATAGENIPEPEPDSSSGSCQSDDECMLPFGSASKCESTGKCKKN